MVGELAYNIFVAWDSANTNSCYIDSNVKPQCWSGESALLLQHMEQEGGWYTLSPGSSNEKTHDRTILPVLNTKIESVHQTASTFKLPPQKSDRKIISKATLAGQIMSVSPFKNSSPTAAMRQSKDGVKLAGEFDLASSRASDYTHLESQGLLHVVPGSNSVLGYDFTPCHEGFDHFGGQERYTFIDNLVLLNAPQNREVGKIVKKIGYAREPQQGGGLSSSDRTCGVKKSPQILTAIRPQMYNGSCKEAIEERIDNYRLLQKESRQGEEQLEPTSGNLCLYPIENKTGIRGGVPLFATGIATDCPASFPPQNAFRTGLLKDVDSHELKSSVAESISPNGVSSVASSPQLLPTNSASAENPLAKKASAHETFKTYSVGTAKSGSGAHSKCIRVPNSTTHAQIESGSPVADIGNSTPATSVCMKEQSGGDTKAPAIAAPSSPLKNTSKLEIIGSPISTTRAPIMDASKMGCLDKKLPVASAPIKDRSEACSIDCHTPESALSPISKASKLISAPHV
eukprot:Platyproteum_vivax@DN8185_c0_g1_i1.p1